MSHSHQSFQTLTKNYFDVCIVILLVACEGDPQEEEHHQ